MHLNDNNDDNPRGDEAPRTTTSTATSSTEDSPVDVNMLTYFMGGSSDESVKKAKAKKNRHRLNNIRHRKRKQNENEKLRKSVVEMERRLMQLREESRQRLYKDGPNIHEENAKRAKLCLDEATEERRLLQNTITAQHQLIAFYEATQPMPNPLRRRRASVS
ncbi:hypothetical protein THRCLA_06455 [Thraustotheca clavata]|uniref:BZIP domain-containing protein n=1 Tax=Thraustotheca clavata TaxID=74557 RepID=A0A1V9ZNL5_9STRA|nr:hypothetical protein THRCLA_06455 [Thraustotheca clavata]